MQIDGDDHYVTVRRNSKFANLTELKVMDQDLKEIYQ